MPISKPNVTFNIIPAEQIVSTQAHRALIVGQLVSGATATAGVIERDVSDATNTINSLFGARSIVAEMVREFKKYNKLTELDVLPVADHGSAVDATAAVAFTGTATESGTLDITFGSNKRYKKTITVTTGDAAADVASAVETAFALYTTSPFTVAASTGTATATASNGGTLANSWTVEASGTVAGITYAVTGWASGATDPTLTGVLDVMGNTRYHTVVWPTSFDVTTVEDVLNARFNTSNDVLDGVAIQTLQGTLSGLKSATSALNSQSLLVVGDKTVAATYRKGAALREIPDVVSAQVGALRALRLTTGSNLSQYVTTSSSLDQFGGSALGSLPYANTALPNLPVPLPEDEFSFEDQAELNSNAVSLLGANRAFNSVVFGDMVTTYLTDTAANSDTSYKYLNTVDTISIIRETFFLNCKNKYAQSRLTTGDLQAGRDMANEASIRAFCLEVYRSLAESTLVQSGSVAERDFLDNLVITLTLSTGTATIAMAPLLVTQLRALTGTIQINFGG